ncbi:hypothetical protein [Catenuloplanes indicus]|uniref:IS5 family transposase n=1 Tax=Catenuloplanes indicus TaxID=137267 RepID=A0AAE4AWN5_9ACTN|nr:hypothetical protein [Catenuloplanes indicus]MDQ0365239.1 IS5 family transposase [Catenuloplanes indicus]
MSDARAALRAADRRWLWALGLLLPAGFRDRQRGEWAADLLTLSADRAVRRDYLLAAARTARRRARGPDRARRRRRGRHAHRVRPRAARVWYLD